MESKCPVCSTQILSEWFYCPSCGKQLKEKVVIPSFGKQLLLYLGSVALAPLGLVWGIKYLFSSNNTLRIIGLICCILTVAALVGAIMLFNTVLAQYSLILQKLTSGTL